MNNIVSITEIERGKMWNRLVQVFSKDDYLKHKRATPKERFDYYIKRSFIEGSPYLPGLYLDKANNDNFGLWLSRYNRFYDRYFSLSLGIHNKLSDDIISSYDETGMGNEFKNGKFYSVASSSRFATASFSENKGGTVSLLNKITINGQKKQCKISLEKDLYVHTSDGRDISSPQMDVFIETDEDIYFIEAKCHEIFDNHEEIWLKWKYMEAKVLQSLLNLPPDSNKYTRITREENGKDVDFIGVDGRYLTSTDFGCELETHHFDFKQFLCHLMGICDFCLTTEKRVHFYYLFYKNEKYIEEESSRIYNELEKELNAVFIHFRNLFPTIEFGAIYNNQFDTLNSMPHPIG